MKHHPTCQYRSEERRCLAKPTVDFTTPLEMASFSLKTGTTFMPSKSSTVVTKFSLKVGSAAWQVNHISGSKDA